MNKNKDKNKTDEKYVRNKVDERHIESIHDITDEIIKYCDGTDNHVTLIGYYDTIVQAFNYLIKESDAMFVNGELYDLEWDNYEDAYCIDYDNQEIWIEKAFHSPDGKEDEWKCVICESDRVYCEEDFLDDFLETNDSENFGSLYVFGFNDVHGDDEPDDCDKPCVCMDDDEHGFSFCIDGEDNHTHFKYRCDKKLTLEDVWKIIEKHFS